MHSKIPVQVVRKWVHTPEPRSAPVSSDTQSKADAAMDLLWTKKGIPNPKTKARKKLLGDTDRLHTLDSMRLLDNTMRVGLNRRLSEFKMTQAKVTRLIDLVRTHQLTLAILCLSFPFLGLWMDRASAQFAMANYLMCREKVLLINFGDPVAHGLWNALKAGAKLSGHLYLMVESGSMLNYNAGPWGSCEWLDKTWSAALNCFTTIKPTDRMLGRFFDRISKETGLPNTLAGKKQYLDTKREAYTERRTMRKSDMFRLCEWFGWVKQWRRAISTWGSLQLVFCFIGIMQGYIKKSSDIFGLYAARGDMVEPTPEPPAPTSSSSGSTSSSSASAPSASASSSASSSSGSADAPAAPSASSSSEGTTGKEPTARRRKLDIKALRAKARTTLHFILELLCSQWLQSLVTMMLVVYGILADEHSEGVIYMMQGSEHVRRWYGNQALGAWKITIVKLFDVFEDLSSLEQFGMDVSLAPLRSGMRIDIDALAYQNALALELWLMVIAQVTTRTVEGFLQSYHMPAMLSALTVPIAKGGDATKARVLARLRASYAAYQRWAGSTNSTVKTMIGRSFWASGLGLLVAVIITEGGDGEIAMLIGYLKLMFEGVGTTKINEDANKFVKEIVMRLRGSTKVRLAVLWSQAVFKNLAKTYHHEDTPIHTTLPTYHKFPEGIFEPCEEGVKTEAGETGLDMASVTGEPDWVLLPSAQWILLAAEDIVLQAWARMNEAAPEHLWKTNLICPFLVLRDTFRQSANQLFLVLKVIQDRCIMVMDLIPDCHGFFRFPKTAKEYHPYFKMVMNISQFMVVPMEIMSPYGARRHVSGVHARAATAFNKFSQLRRTKGYSGPLPRLPPEQVDRLGVKLLRADGPEQSLVMYHHERGFAGVTTTTMTKLIEELKVDLALVEKAAKCAYEEEEAKALALMMGLEEKITLLKVQLALEQRRSGVRGEIAGLQALLKYDVIRDLMVHEDIGLVRDLVEDAEEAVDTAKEARLNAKRHVKAVFKEHLEGNHYKEREAEYESKTRPPPFVPLATGDTDLQILDKLKAPWPVKTTKEKAGYYLITYQGVHQRSYSWTSIRTPKEALQLALMKSWDVSKRKLGIHPLEETWEAIQGILHMDIPGLNREGDGGD